MEIKRIEIGAGKWPVAGFYHIDIEPGRGIDAVGDFRKMSFSNIEEIRAHHLLEHFGYTEVIEVLKQLHSWLMVDGRLIVETPDFERICAIFDNGGYWADKEHMMIHAFGSQEADWAYHKIGWYKERYEKILPELGFEIELIKQKHSYIRYGDRKTRYRLPNILVIAKKI